MHKINLLTLDDIAALMKLSRYHVRDVVVKSPGFPLPVPGTGPRKPRWLESAVLQFLSGGYGEHAESQNE